MRDERCGTRDLSYSQWHRVKSIKRYVGIERAIPLTMFDIDVMPWVETAEYGKTPIALIETAIDKGQHDKESHLGVLGRMAGLPAYVVLYKLSNDCNPASPEWRDIESFRVKELYPNTQKSWTWMSPGEYAEWLIAKRVQWSDSVDRRCTK